MTVPGSTPAIAPLYPDPPYEFPNAEFYALSYPLGAERLRGLLAPGLEPPAEDDAMCLLLLARYPESTIGPYEEISWMLPAQRDGELGYYCPLMYLTSDAGLAAGRELYGWPKKLARITWTELGEDRQQVVMERDGHQLLSVRLQITERFPVGEGEGVPPRQLIYNLRHIPPVDPEQPARTYLTLTHTTQVAREQALGLASVRLTGSAADPVQLLAPPDARVPVAYARADFALPPPTAAYPVA